MGKFGGETAQQEIGGGTEKLRLPDGATSVALRELEVRDQFIYTSEATRGMYLPESVKTVERVDLPEITFSYISLGGDNGTHTTDVNNNSNKVYKVS